MQISHREVAALFGSVYERETEVCGFAPGRVNLIGEHTDYNGGQVFPCAIDLGITCAAARREDRLLRFYSANFPDAGVLQCSLDELSVGGSWCDYPKSVILTFARFGYAPESGADFVFAGNLPDGAGLSSSAALEVLTGTVLRKLYGMPVTPQQIAVFGQFAENRFIGVNCGIMDQFASAMGRQDHAVLLDTHTLAFDYAPIDSSKAAIVIVNSGVKHSLASSAYNDRRRECEAALSALSGKGKLSSLCALHPDQFEQYKDAIPDEVCRRRAKHAVYENERTTQAAAALKKGDLAAFGRLMNESHRSLREDYEVSCAELDFLAETAQQIDGVYGARMTGGGFGGCTVNLVQKDAAQAFCQSITAAYRDRFGIEAPTYIIRPGEGAKARTFVR